MVRTPCDTRRCRQESSHKRGMFHFCNKHYLESLPDGHPDKHPIKIGQFGATTREIEINGKKYQMWGFDTKSKSSANQYADQLRRNGKDVIVQESKNPDSIHGWAIFARKRPGRKIGSFGEEKQNGYICLYKGKKYEIYADSTFDAQKKCALVHNIKKRHEISVHLAEKNGKPVTHVADF